MVNKVTTPEDWLAENRDALESSNDFVARNGLPLARYRYNQPSEADHQEQHTGDTEEK